LAGFFNPRITCTPGNTGCTVAQLQATPTFCVAGYRPDPFLDFSQAICPNGTGSVKPEFQRISGGCTSLFCRFNTATFPNARSSIARCNSNAGCHLNEFQSGSIVCNPNFYPNFTFAASQCNFTTPISSFSNIFGSCLPVSCIVPPAYFSSQYTTSTVCPGTCSLAVAQTIGCKAPSIPLVTNPFNTSGIFCTAQGGTWSNFVGTCL